MWFYYDYESDGTKNLIGPFPTSSAAYEANCHARRNGHHVGVVFRREGMGGWYEKIGGRRVHY